VTWAIDKRDVTIKNEFRLAPFIRAFYIIGTRRTERLETLWRGASWASEQFGISIPEFNSNISELLTEVANGLAELLK
jgi:hypothetical protein